MATALMEGASFYETPAPVVAGAKSSRPLQSYGTGTSHVNSPADNAASQWAQSLLGTPLFRRLSRILQGYLTAFIETENSNIQSMY
ncbi:hypothetical protein ABKN59_003234 [Abortiporus biennis]